MSLSRKWLTKAHLPLKALGLGLIMFKAQIAAAAVYGGGGVRSGINEVSGIGGISTISSLSELIIKIIKFILDFVLLLAVGAIIIAGIYLIVSNGDEGQKDKAKKIVYYAVAGIVLVLLSRVIVLFVNTIFQ